MSKFEPMKFYNGTWEWSDIRWPKFALPKYDGVFVMHWNGKALTRQMKPVQNKYLAEIILTHMPEGVQGEFWIIGKNFHDIQSVAMSKDKELCRDSCRIMCFDVYRPGYCFIPYHKRFKDMVDIIDLWSNVSSEFIVMPSPIFTVESAQEAEKRLESLELRTGIEGLVLRDPSAGYKFGRSTLSENSAFKLVRWKQECGELIDWTPNTGLTKKDQIGAMVIKTKEWGIIEVGSGFDVALSMRMRQHFDEYKGAEVQFKYRPDSTKNKPRQPIFVGFPTVS